jgi:hypothetical protein
MKSIGAVQYELELDTQTNVIKKAYILLEFYI